MNNQTYAYQLMFAQEMYYVGEKAIDKTEINNNDMVDGCYGKGIYLFSSSKDAVKSYLENHGNVHNQVSLFKYNANPFSIVKPQFDEYLWGYCLNYFEGKSIPYVSLMRRGEFMCEKLLRPHLNERSNWEHLPFVAGPIVNKDFLVNHYGTEDDIHVALQFNDPNRVLASEHPFCFCLKDTRAFVAFSWRDCGDHISLLEKPNHMGSFVNVEDMKQYAGV